jgi:SAM-dependent methyltransferase
MKATARPKGEAYRDDLAFIHDAGFGGFARDAAAFLLAALRRQRWAGGLVVDLGCGSGILAERLAAAGFDVLGIDISAAMVALARQRVPGGRFRQGSLLTAELPPCVAVTAVGECVNYQFDPGNTRQGLHKLFRRTYQALGRGGLLIFDVAEPGRVPGSGLQRTFREGEGWAVLVTAEEDRRRGLLTRRITSFRKVGEVYRRDHEIHRLRLFRRSEVAGQLRRIGFRVRVLSGYGREPFPPGYAGFLARKP